MLVRVENAAIVNSKDMLHVAEALRSLYNAVVDDCESRGETIDYQQVALLAITQASIAEALALVLDRLDELKPKIRDVSCDAAADCNNLTCRYRTPHKHTPVCGEACASNETAACVEC